MVEYVSNNVAPNLCSDLIVAYFKALSTQIKVIFHKIPGGDHVSASMSSFSALNHLEPTFNVSVPTLLNAVFLFDNGDNSASWSPYPDLAEGIRNCLIEGVGCLPRK